MIEAKIPPQAVDIEEVILGAMMLETERLTEVFDIIKAEMFYREANQIIFKAIQYLFSNSFPVDILTVTDRLRDAGQIDLVGGAYYVTGLCSRVSSSANIEYHSRIIQEKYIQRELIRIAHELDRDGYDDSIDVFDKLEKAEQQIYAISQESTRHDSTQIAALLSEELNQLDMRTMNRGKLIGIGSGFTSLDRITNGWQKSDLIIIAARPGMGKTALAISAARNSALDFGCPTAIFSLEMSSSQIAQRMISSESEVDLSQIRSGQVGRSVLAEAAGTVSSAPIFIDDTAALSIFDLRSRARKMKRKHGIELVIVDYLQLMKGTRDRNGNREQEISSISQGLKALAKELNIPVIALSQLSRAVESRSDKTPLLSDLRESGSIEQDADMVIFLYRPAYYKETRDNGEVDEKALDVIIAKHRNGPLDTVGLMFQGNIVKVSDWKTLKTPF